jgi:translocation and assembly module TamB
LTRRSLKVAAWVLGALALLLMLSIGTVLIVGNTAAGRVQIERLTARLTGGHVQLSGLGGSFPSHLTLAQLQLRDAAGVWLTATRIELDWTPLAYLEGRLQIERLHAAAVDMERLPQSSASPGGGEASIPRIDVAQASFDTLHLGASLAGAPALLSAAGSAHLRTIHDMLFDAAARRIDGDGEYELHLHFDEKRMDGSLKLHEPAGGPLENILSLPGLGALQAVVNLTGPRSAEQLDISLQAGSLKGHAQGSLDLSALSADLAFSFESGPVNPRPDLGWERAVLNGRWHGKVKSPNAEGHLEVTHLRVPGGAQAAALTADLAANLGNAELHALARGLRIPGAQPRLLEDDPLQIDASVRLDDPARRLEVTASHRLFALRGQAVTAGEQSATVELRLPNVTPFAAYAAQDLRGSAVINARLSGYPGATQIKLDASSALIPGAQVWARAIGDRARLEFSGSFKDAALTVDNLKLTGRALALGANGSVSARSIKARWDLALSDLGLVSSALAGTMQGSGSVEGPPAALAAEASLNSTLSIRGSQSGRLSAEVKVRGLPTTPAGTLIAQGSLDGAPLNLDVAMERRADRALHAVIHRANWRSVHMDGDIVLAPEKAQVHGQLVLAVAQLQDLQHLLGMEIAGSLAGNLALRPDGQRTRAHLQIDAQDLMLAGLAGGAHVSGEGFTDSFAFNAGVKIPKLKGAAASLETSGNLNLDSSEVSLTGALGSYRGQEFHLLEPARILFARGVSVDLKLGSQKAEFDLQGHVAPTLDLRASLRNVQPALINVFLPNLLAAGVIDANADLHGSFANPMGEITVHALGIQSADDAALGLPPANFRLKAGLRGHTADIDARLDAGAASQLSAVGEAPLANDGEVDMKINGKLDVGVMNPFLEARGQHASGQLDIDATVTGSVAAPQIAGTLELKNGKVNDYGRGVSLTDITAQIAGNEGALQIKNFTASAPPGTVSMSGAVGILQKGIPVDLKITARDAQPIVSKLVTSNLNADLAIKGTARERLDVSGSVHLNRTLIGIPNGLPLNVAVLDVRRRGTKTVVVPEKPLIIGLGVSVQAPQEILVQGRGLDAEMGGDLQISGTTDSPFVTGGFDLQRGTFSLATGRLNFSAGRVSFNGAGLRNKIDPTLDFTAQATVGDTTAIMHITGLADAPQFDFTSNPSKPQDEIMALLLFGAPTQQLTPLQLAQVGAALASFSGVGGDGGLNPLVKIQRSLGLDRLTVGAGTTTTPTGADTGASIAAGRYVSKRVYIEAKQSTTGTSQLEADVDLTKHLKLQTRLGNGAASVQGTTPDNDPGSSVGLRYQFEY